MIETIKQFHQENGYYPNRVQLAKILGKDRRTIEKRLKKMIKAKELKKEEPVHIVSGDYSVV